MRTSFHQDVQQVEEGVVRLGELVEHQTERAVESVIRSDVALAEEVVATDREVNRLEHTILVRCLSLIALQAPVARDLRELTTIQMVGRELERMGDHAADIAKQTLRRTDDAETPESDELAELGRLVARQVHDSVRAFLDADVGFAREVSARDDEIDHRYHRIFDTLIASMTQNPSEVPVSTSLLFIAHRLERIADRATNICEHVVFMVTGDVEELN